MTRLPLWVRMVAWVLGNLGGCYLGFHLIHPETHRCVGCGMEP